MAVSSLPLLVYGQVNESGSGVDSITVKVRNNTTNEVGTATTTSNGLYLIDIGSGDSFPSGWADGQQITIYTIYKSFEGETTFTITLPAYGYEQNITLSAVTDSELINYCSAQDVYDELDGKTASDIESRRVINAIQRAEGLINSKTRTFFKQVTLTDETHTVDRNTVETSVDFLDTVASMSTLRRDAGLGGMASNRVKTKFGPIVSVTSLSYNQAGYSEADSWTVLTEQTGSGGGFIVEDRDARIIDFLTAFPRWGKRGWKITYVAGYDRDSTDEFVIAILKVVERLTILLSVKSIITTKATGGSFDSGRSVTIGKIQISSGSVSNMQYLRSIQPEIDELWAEVGGMLQIEVV